MQRLNLTFFGALVNYYALECEQVDVVACHAYMDTQRKREQEWSQVMTGQG